MRPESREDDRGRKSEEVGDISHEEVSFEEQYREVAISCFRYLGFTSFEQVDRLTIAQYEIMMEALRYRIDRKSTRLNSSHPSSSRMPSSA